MTPRPRKATIVHTLRTVDKSNINSLTGAVSFGAVFATASSGATRRRQRLRRHALDLAMAPRVDNLPDKSDLKAGTAVRFRRV